MFHFEHPKNLHVIYGVNHPLEYLSTDVLTRIYGDWMSRTEYISLRVEVGLKPSVLPSLPLYWKGIPTRKPLLNVFMFLKALTANKKASSLLGGPKINISAGYEFTHSPCKKASKKYQTAL